MGKVILSVTRKPETIKEKIDTGTYKLKTFLQKKYKMELNKKQEKLAIYMGKDCCLLQTRPKTVRGAGKCLGIKACGNVIRLPTKAKTYKDNDYTKDFKIPGNKGNMNKCNNKIAFIACEAEKDSSRWSTASAGV